jgi:hypothetical protein
MLVKLTQGGQEEYKTSFLHLFTISDTLQHTRHFYYSATTRGKTRQRTTIRPTTPTATTTTTTRPVKVFQEIFYHT